MKLRKIFKNKRNFGKRFIAMSMALAMCLTSPGASINIYAEDLNTNLAEDDFEELASEDAHKVVLEASGSGKVFFYDEEKGVTSDVMEAEFNEGDKVGIKLEADEGKSIKAFVIRDSEGNTIYYTDTHDNYFEFTMPKYDITVEGKFEVALEEVVIDLNGVSDTGSSVWSFSIKGEDSDSNPYAEGMRKYIVKRFKNGADRAYDNKTPIGTDIDISDIKGYIRAFKNTPSETACTDLVINAYKDAGGNDLSSYRTAAALGNKLHDNEKWKVVYKFHYEYDQNDHVSHTYAYKDGITDNAHKVNEVILHPGDVLIYAKEREDVTNPDYWDPVKQKTHAEHVDFVADVDRNRILIADNDGSTSSTCLLSAQYYFQFYWSADGNFKFITIDPGNVEGEYVLEEVEDTDGLVEGKDYIKVKEADYDKVEEAVKNGLASSVEDLSRLGFGNSLTISTEEGSANYVTVLRYEENETGPLKIKKAASTDIACKTMVMKNGAQNTSSAQNDVERTYKYVVSKLHGGLYTEGYGAMSEARFKVYKKRERNQLATVTKGGVAVNQSDQNNKQDNNGLQPNKTYKVEGLESDNKAYIIESRAPKGYDLSSGWKPSRDGVVLQEGETTIVTVEDTFTPATLFSFKKLDANGDAVEGALFEISNSENNKTWTFKSDANGVVDLRSLDYAVDGTFAVNKDNNKEIVWFASDATFSLKELPSDANKRLSSGYISYNNGTSYQALGKGGTIVSWTIASSTGERENANDDYAYGHVINGGKATVSYNKVVTGIVIKNSNVLPIKVTKKGGDTSYSYTIKSNGTVTGTGTETLSDIANKRSKYGAITTARFGVYKQSTGGTPITVYGTYNSSTEVFGSSTTSLVAGQTYYIKADDDSFKTLYMGETTTPTGWSTASRKGFNTVPGTTQDVEMTDTFAPTTMFNGFKYIGAAGKGEAGAEFTLTRTDTDSDTNKTWVFVSDANGKVDFNNIGYMKSGKAYISSGTTIAWFAGEYTLTLTKIPGARKDADFTLQYGSNTYDYKDITENSALLRFSINSTNGVASVTNVRKADNTLITNDKPASFSVIDKDYRIIEIKKISDPTPVPTVVCENGVVKNPGETSTTIGDIANKYSFYGSLDDARFNVYKTNAKTEYATLYSDASCKTQVSNDATHKLKAGTYYAKAEDIDTSTLFAVETTTPTGWKTDDGKNLVQDPSDEKKYTFTLEDTFTGDPFVLHIEKEGYTDNKITGAKFTVKNTETNEEWVFVSKDGIVDFRNPDYLYNGTMVKQEDQLVFFPGNYTVTETEPAYGYLKKGKVTVTKLGGGTETKEYDGKVMEFDVIGLDDGSGESYTEANVVNITADVDPDSDQLLIEDKPKMFGFKMSKVSRETNANTLMGMMDDYTTVFEIYYVGRHGETDAASASTWIDYDLDGEYDGVSEKVTKNGKVRCRTVNADNSVTFSDTWTTDKNGLYTSPAKYLQAGTYKMVEKRPPKGMIGDSTDNIVRYFKITDAEKNLSDAEKANSEAWKTIEDGDVVDITINDGPFVNSQRRGGFAGFKYDKSTMRITPLAGSSFAGIEIWVRNDNPHLVYIDENGDGVGEILLNPGEMHKVCTLTDGADKKALYSTNPTYLSYGKYTVFEKQGTNKDYIVDSEYSEKGIQITITNDMDYWLLVRDSEKETTVNAVKTAQAAAIAAIGMHTNDGVARVPDYKTLGDGFSALFANEASRHGVAIIKYDADDYAKAITERNPVWGEYYPEPQGDAVLTGAIYQIINNNGGDITIDTDNDHKGDTIVGANGVCIEITTTWDEDTGLEYALTHHTLLPNGSFIIKEKEASAGYLHNKNDGKAVYEHTYTATEDGQYFIFASSTDAAERLERIVNRKFTETHFLNSHVHTIKFVRKLYDKFTDPVKRNGLTIKKNDADRREHLLAKAVNGTVSNDYESKYAQGDATLGGATYKIYNISEHYVYTNPVSETVFTRYETGRKVFEANTGIDVSALSFKDGICTDDLTISDRVAEELNVKLADYACYTLVTDAAGNASTYNNSLPYGTYLVLETKESVGYLNSSKRGGRTFQIVRIRDEYNGTNRTDLTFSLTRLEKSLYEPVIRGGFEFFKYDDDSRENLAQGVIRQIKWRSFRQFI